MPKSLTFLTLAALAAVLCAMTAAAQTSPAQSPAAPAEWVVVSPEGEGFTARMPSPPDASEQSIKSGETDASGRRYAASSEDGTGFAVWVMKGSHGETPLAAPNQRAWFAGGDFYLDAVAELAWELLVTPETQRIEREGAARDRPAGSNVGMSYAREFELGGRRAREYSVRLEKARGLVYVYADETRAYVVTALGAGADNARLKQFLDSFAPEGVASPRAPGGVAGTSEGGGSVTGAVAADTAVGGGPADETAVDYTRPFKFDEVTKKAIITAKPEPGFTEEARKFNVSGVVRLRAILSASGKVQAVLVLKGLPHGLTKKALAAAQGVRFDPAQKDGRIVSQFVTFEYNFNIY